ncbi:MAG: hypothetical protein KF891_22520 [Rhizobacter sp.]|nr:hypothetical protein [Rhizobacter sp.]
MRPRQASQPHTHLAYAAYGPGLVYALTWFADGPHVVGWYIGHQGGQVQASYFMLQGYYTAHDTVFMRTLQDDLDGPWAELRLGEYLPLDASPLPDAVRHELARVQDQFVRHWLAFDDDPAAAAELQALQDRQVPVRHVNVRAARLDELTPGPTTWRHDSPGADLNVLAYLGARWPLDPPA